MRPAYLGDAPPTVALRQELDELGGRLAPAGGDRSGDPCVARHLLAKEAQLVHPARGLHEKLRRAQVIPADDARLVEPVEEVEHRSRDVDRAVEHLFDLARHHPEELVPADELELDRRLPHPFAASLGGAHHLVELLARDRAEAPEDLAELLRRDGRRRADDLAGLEEDRPRSLFLQDGQLPSPARLGDQRDDIAEGARRAHLAGEPQRSPLARTQREDDLGRTVQERPLADSRAERLAGVTTDRMDGPGAVDPQATAPIAVLIAGHPL